ncbi:hypothetical protein BO85DRAFT_125068 [Aspergillus piperis CBS 112811]|uniref:Uncharacterized protein n=1 Tax=Aspergillus piperis CBS 112811 TaxID=1448313 RepID=A0A8G1R8K4_9EURO|nr:hypothetical protein BO85DRAFT_125068 [Aspergillus piperis CBS 112811]RAH62066.1 hypothetical protein BO85DRAFT_125068 [Aspergillus piperis CBS 112811]
MTSLPRDRPASLYLLPRISSFTLHAYAVNNSTPSLTFWPTLGFVRPLLSSPTNLNCLGKPWAQPNSSFYL